MISVRATAMDGRKEGFEAVFIESATRPVTAKGGEKARREMLDAGIRRIA